jgi:hypothetical protein
MKNGKVLLFCDFSADQCHDRIQRRRNGGAALGGGA